MYNKIFVKIYKSSSKTQILHTLLNVTVLGAQQFLLDKVSQSINIQIKFLILGLQNAPNWNRPEDPDRGCLITAEHDKHVSVCGHTFCMNSLLFSRYFLKIVYQSS